VFQATLALKPLKVTEVTTKAHTAIMLPEENIGLMTPLMVSQALNQLKPLILTPDTTFLNMTIIKTIQAPGHTKLEIL
jgi:hypothetical protein